MLNNEMVKNMDRRNQNGGETKGPLDFVAPWLDFDTAL